MLKNFLTLISGPKPASAAELEAERVALAAVIASKTTERSQIDATRATQWADPKALKASGDAIRTLDAELADLQVQHEGLAGAIDKARKAEAETELARDEAEGLALTDICRERDGRIRKQILDLLADCSDQRRDRRAIAQKLERQRAAGRATKLRPLGHALGEREALEDRVILPDPNRADAIVWGGFGATPPAQPAE